MDVYLVTLVGVGELELILVDKATWDYIHEHKEWGDNDRALESEPLTLNSEQVEIFGTVLELMNFVKTNNLSIVGEYRGGIY